MAAPRETSEVRLVFVTPRFRAGDATLPELLAAELADRAPGGWRTTVLTTTAAGDSREPFRDGEIQEKGVRVVRFPAEVPSPSGSDGQAAPDLLRSSDLVEHLRDRSNDYDLVVLFGSSPVCLEAAKVDPGRTVLLPFIDEEAVASSDSQIFRHPAAFVFGSEAEEVLILKRYQVHRRMRETIAGALLLPRTADRSAFRQRTGLTGHYLLSAGPLEPGRGVEELLRFFSTFRDRHPDSALELVLLGPAALRIPKRPDIRVVSPKNTPERLDVVGGALVAVTPERLAAFSTTAAEPFSLGVPILVNASATGLAEDCRASGGGLYYQNYDEFELILELGLRDPSLFARMGKAGRGFLQSRHDWDLVLARYDGAFRSFARPSRASVDAQSGEPIPVPATPDTRVPEREVEAPVPTSFFEASARRPHPAGRAFLVSEGESAEGDSDESPPQPGSGSESEPATEASEGSRAEASPPDESAETSELQAAPEVESETQEPAASDQDPGLSASEDAAAEHETRTGDASLPNFFRSSLRD